MRKCTVAFHQITETHLAGVVAALCACVRVRLWNNAVEMNCVIYDDGVASRAPLTIFVFARNLLYMCVYALEWINAAAMHCAAGSSVSKSAIPVQLPFACVNLLFSFIFLWTNHCLCVSRIWSDSMGKGRGGKRRKSKIPYKCRPECVVRAD